MDGKVLGVERRRRWSKDEKARIVEETLAPGASVERVARAHGINANQVFSWRPPYSSSIRRIAKGNIFRGTLQADAYAGFNQLYAVALRAAQLRAHMPHHHETGGHVLQHLGDILA